jgi:Na+/H+-dicarboxylate symporter
MSEERSWLDYYTSPWLGLALLLTGLSLGTWASGLVTPVQDTVDYLITGLNTAAPYIILFTVLPALVDLFDTAGGRAPLIVLLLFLASSVTAGLFGLVSAGLVFQLPLTGGGGGGFIDVLVDSLADLSAAPAITAVFWAFASAIVLHFLIALDRKTADDGLLAGVIGPLGYFARQTRRIFLIIFEKGVDRLGGLLEYTIPILLFSIGTYVPVSVQDASQRAAEASEGFNAVAWYLGTAALIAGATLVFLALVGVLAIKLTGRDPGKAFREYVVPVYAFAWSSVSSTATIPINLEKADEGLDARESTRGFVIPLGATINLDGTLIASMLITPVVAKAIGLGLTFPELAATLLPLLVMTVGAPGLPAGMSFLAPPVIAAVLGLEGAISEAFIGVWFAFSLGLADQFRTGVNSVNNGFITLIAERILYGPEPAVDASGADEPEPTPA